MTLSTRIQNAVDYIRSRTDMTPEMGMILGSGLGDFADTLENRQIIPFTDQLHLAAGHFFLLHSFDITDETIKRSLLPFPVHQCLIHQCPQVGLTLPASRHGSHSQIETGIQHQFPHQLFQRHENRQRLPFRQ